MTDREMLKLAAKAAGYPIAPHPNQKLFPSLAFVLGNSNWNPLTDDGDALRLAVKLEIGIWFGANYVICGGVQEPTVNNAGNPYAAVRRAIVRAAAEIGMAKP